MLKKVAYGTIGAFVALVLLWFFFPWDDAEIIDADLVVAQPVVVPEENVYLFLPKANDFNSTEEAAFVFVTDPDNDMLRADSIVAYSSYISATNRIRKKVADAADHTGFSCPAEAACEYDYMRDLLTLLLVHARYQEEIGNISVAAVYYVDALTLGRYLMSQPDIISYLVGSMPYALMTELVAENKTSQATYVEALDTMPPDQQHMVQTIKSEYQSQKDIILNGWSDVRPTYWVQPNQTVNELADFARLQVSYFEQPCGAGVVVLSEMEESISEYRNTLSSFTSFVSQNLEGRVTLSVMVVSLSGLKDTYCAVEEMYETLRLE